jgi:hypothetical protein
MLRRHTSGTATRPFGFRLPIAMLPTASHAAETVMAPSFSGSCPGSVSRPRIWVPVADPNEGEPVAVPISGSRICAPRPPSPD